MRKNHQIPGIVQDSENFDLYLFKNSHALTKLRAFSEVDFTGHRSQKDLFTKFYFSLLCDNVLFPNLFKNLYSLRWDQIVFINKSEAIIHLDTTKSTKNSKNSIEILISGRSYMILTCLFPKELRPKIKRNREFPAKYNWSKEQQIVFNIIPRDFKSHPVEKQNKAKRLQYRGHINREFRKVDLEGKIEELEDNIQMAIGIYNLPPFYLSILNPSKLGYQRASQQSEDALITGCGAAVQYKSTKAEQEKIEKIYDLQESFDIEFDQLLANGYTTLPEKPLSKEDVSKFKKIKEEANLINDHFQKFLLLINKEAYADTKTGKNDFAIKVISDSLVFLKDIPESNFGQLLKSLILYSIFRLEKREITGLYYELKSIFPFLISNLYTIFPETLTTEATIKILNKFNRGSPYDRHSIIRDFLFFAQREGVLYCEIDFHSVKSKIKTTDLKLLKERQLIGALEVHAVMDELSNMYGNKAHIYQIYVILAYCAGLRRSEVFNLKVKDIYFKKLDSLPAWEDIEYACVLWVNGTKSNAAKRPLPLHFLLAPALRCQFYAFLTGRLSQSMPDDPLIPYTKELPKKITKQFRKNSINSIGEKISKIMQSVTGRPVSMHDLRRTFATTCVLKFFEQSTGEKIFKLTDSMSYKAQSGIEYSSINAISYQPIPDEYVVRIHDSFADTTNQYTREDLLFTAFPTTSAMLGHMSLTTLLTNYFSLPIVLLRHLIKTQFFDQRDLSNIFLD